MSNTDIFDSLQNKDSGSDTIKTNDVMESDFFMFDPMKTESSIPISQIDDREETDKEERQERSEVKQDNVVIEDLLGGISEERSGDNVVVSGDGADRIRSTTSFFLLDLDDNGSGGVLQDRDGDNIDGEVSLSSVPSEVLSVHDENLPFDEGDTEPVSGFFFNELLTEENDKPR